MSRELWQEELRRAGIELKGESVTEIHDAIMEVLNNGKYADAAMSCSDDFRSALGPKGAADFIEAAPHLMPEEDKKNIRREIIPGVLQFYLIFSYLPYQKTYNNHLCFLSSRLREVTNGGL